MKNSVNRLYRLLYLLDRLNIKAATPARIKHLVAINYMMRRDKSRTLEIPPWMS